MVMTFWERIIGNTEEYVYVIEGDKSSGVIQLGFSSGKLFSFSYSWLLLRLLSLCLITTLIPLFILAVFLQYAFILADILHVHSVIYIHTVHENNCMR